MMALTAPGRRLAFRPLPPGAAGPSLVWPLAVAALFRLAYGIDSLVHGSPQMLAAGGWGFTIGWGLAVIAANAINLAGIGVSAWTGWRHERLELVGSIAVTALAAGFLAAVGWNATHTLASQGFVVGWQQPALSALSAWRIANIARNERRRPAANGGTR